jgi:hypothetical protein
MSTRSADKAGTCALCLSNGPLRDSHIISEFLYSSLYDDKHRFHVLEAGEKYTDFKQRGYYEPLLCQSCETKLSVWESYARGALTGGRLFQYRREGNITWVEGIDYTRFKLFQLSILWRAGVAKDEFFRKVSLGPHAETLRGMLLAEDPRRALAVRMSDDWHSPERQHGPGDRAADAPAHRGCAGHTIHLWRLFLGLPDCESQADSACL